ncbi:MAG: 30S ribosomal protein S17 [Candidatus Magasanikbacteria bacterium CG10_big_fil_rev_8_21_14_0_10_36_16]|uniref:Small ribosomal subunit protein uS17 n=1 Tax=Candidatus Magasanikbacteria bacterium CG10_big_fil_rev_8_21_14_0_10_36_16 TaxID=1974645 RepID=A0A2H0TZ12_9BACT|nr:MAG: 30S ribosomal protein S17 [Candidatus Magasanikbacteria bacterium CG10_big_fil_rev_8_21_14_0_10_36_16]
MSDTKKTQHRNFEGEVVSVAENKTIHVIVKTTKMHPKYRKQYVVSRKFAVHDEHSRAKLGNLVTFVECRPISKTKKWTLVNIIK